MCLIYQHCLWSNYFFYSFSNKIGWHICREARRVIPCRHGDASVNVGDLDMRVGPISTITSCMIAQSIVVQADEYLWQSGVRPPVYVSGNIPGGMEQNRELIRRYMPRNKHL